MAGMLLLDFDSCRSQGYTSRNQPDFDSRAVFERPNSKIDKINQNQTID